MLRKHTKPNTLVGYMYQGLTHEDNATLGRADIIETVQRSLVLLCNTNNFISETRREWALEAIHPTLRKYGKGDFTEAD